MNEVEKRQVEAFSKYLVEKYKTYFVKNGGIPSESDFAQEIGISPTDFSKWKNKRVVPSDRSIDIVATALGPEVYDIFDRPRRMPNDKRLARIAVLWPKMKENHRRELEELARNYADENNAEQKNDNGGMATA